MNKHNDEKILSALHHSVEVLEQMTRGMVWSDVVSGGGGVLGSMKPVHDRGDMLRRTP